MKSIRWAIWTLTLVYGLISVIGYGTLLASAIGMNLDWFGGSLILSRAIIVSLVGIIGIVSLYATGVCVDIILSILGSPQKLLGNWKEYVLAGLLVTILGLSLSLVFEQSEPLLYGTLTFLSSGLTFFAGWALIEERGTIIRQGDQQESFWYENVLLVSMLWGIVPGLLGVYSRNTITMIPVVFLLGVVCIVGMLKSGQTSRFRTIIIGMFLIYLAGLSFERTIVHSSFQNVSTCREYPLFVSAGSIWGGKYRWYTPTQVPGIFEYRGSSWEYQTQKYVVKQFGDQYMDCLQFDQN